MLLIVADSFLSLATVEVPWKDATPISSMVKLKAANAPLNGAILDQTCRMNYPIVS